MSIKKKSVPILGFWYAYKALRDNQTGEVNCEKRLRTYSFSPSESVQVSNKEGERHDRRSPSRFVDHKASRHGSRSERHVNPKDRISLLAVKWGLVYWTRSRMMAISSGISRQRCIEGYKY